MADGEAAKGRRTGVPRRIRSDNQHFVGREWTLADLAHWLDGDAPVMVLTGLPGAGKSALSGWLAGAGPEPADPSQAATLERLRAAWAAVHFCEAPASIDPRYFTEQLALRLAALPGFPDAAIESIGQRITINQQVTGESAVVTAVKNLTVQTLDTVETFRACVVAPLTRVLDESPELTVVVLIDGLDQAVPSGTETTVITLVKAMVGIEGLRLLISTRSEGAVLRSVDDGKGGASFLDLSADGARDRAREDLRRYVVSRLGKAEPPPPAMAIDQLVQVADGNFTFADFFLDEVERGERELTDLSRVPSTLYGLYDAYLGRASARLGDEAWLAECHVLLGYVSVSLPVAPSDALPRWAGIADDAAFARRMSDLGQLVRLDESAGGWRMYHRSMTEFLGTSEIPLHGAKAPNRWYVDPARLHRQVAEYYLGIGRGARGWPACDDYGIERLVGHLVRALRLAGARPEFDALVDDLATVVSSESFRDEQVRRFPDAFPTTHDLRAALSLIAERRPLARTLAIANTLAQDPRPAVRAAAVQALVDAHSRDPGAVVEKLRAMLSSKAVTARGTALNTAYRLGPEAEELFLEIARSPDVQLRRAASIALYLRWRPGPDNFTRQLLFELSDKARPTPTKKMQAMLEFMSDLSIAVYINNCEDRSVGEMTSELWRRTLKDRLRLHLINQPVLDRALVAVVSRAFAGRMLETALLADSTEVPKLFDLARGDAERVQRVVPFLDPSSDPGTVSEDLLKLFSSDIPLLKAVAAMTINIHAHVDLDQTAALANRLFDVASGPSRLWVVLGFTTRLPEAAPGWTVVVEGLTERLVNEEGELFESGRAGGLTDLDLIVLPLFEAYAQAGASMPLLTRLLSERPREHPGRTTRIVSALSSGGLRFPQQVLDLVAPLVAVRDMPGLEDALVNCLAPLRVAHPQLIDKALADWATPSLRERVLAADDVQLVWRQIWWLGLYKNAVHQALHYPRMRKNLLQAGILSLVTARKPKDFLGSFALVPLRMLREADYELVGWTLP